MARTQYSEVVTYVDAGVLKPADNARVSVYLPATTTLVTIYTTRTAGTLQSNPFTTDATGAVEFWAEWGDYDIKYEDLTVPARFGTKTFGWSSSSGASAAIPLTALSAVATRQFAPVGTVITWWRPDNTVSVPTGWAICNGASVASGSHDFGTGASITLPDLRNKFVLGANSALADAAAATDGDTVANAPGIRGSGSSNARNLQHSHSVNSHDHGSAGSHTHGVGTGGAIAGGGVGGASFSIGGFSDVHSHLGNTDAQGAHTHAAQTPGTNNQLGSAQDIKPQYVGLLHIIKIKRD